jgi:hypothetical protein
LTIFFCSAQIKLVTGFTAGCDQVGTVWPKRVLIQKFFEYGLFIFKFLISLISPFISDPDAARRYCDAFGNELFWGGHRVITSLVSKSVVEESAPAVASAQPQPVKQKRSYNKRST